MAAEILGGVCIETVCFFFFFQAEDGIRDGHVTGVQTCALPILPLEVRGLPAFRFEVSDMDDAVEKGGTVVYKIDVTNQGSLAGNQVQVLGTLPKRSEERRVGKECRSRWSAEAEKKKRTSMMSST